MKALFRALISASMIVLWANSALAQTADDIIEKYLAATGGRAAISAVKSRVVTGPAGSVSCLVGFAGRFAVTRRT